VERFWNWYAIGMVPMHTPPMKQLHRLAALTLLLVTACN
jgi:hypothetical protein